MGASLEPSEISSSPTLITFTIAGTTYQAEEGMTWYDWVESEYNTDGYRATSTAVNGQIGSVHYNFNSVLPTDYIVANASYSEYQHSGGADN